MMRYAKPRKTPKTRFTTSRHLHFGRNPGMKHICVILALKSSVQRITGYLINPKRAHRPVTIHTTWQYPEIREINQKKDRRTGPCAGGRGYAPDIPDIRRGHDEGKVVVFL